jgi:hypothetical protein
VNDRAVATNAGPLRRSLDAILGPKLVFAGVAAAFASMFVAVVMLAVAVGGLLAESRQEPAEASAQEVVNV